MKKNQSHGQHCRFLLKKALSYPEKRKRRKGVFHDTKKPVRFRFPVQLGETMVAPPDLRLLDNTNEALSFIRSVRTSPGTEQIYRSSYISMDLKNVCHVDYPTSCILTALNEDFKVKKVAIRTSMPVNYDCAEYLKESGYLNNLFDVRGRKLHSSSSARHVLFEMGNNRLTESQRRNISELIHDAYTHLGICPLSSKTVKTITLEACANAIEWGATKSRNWVFGIKKRSDEVIFSVTDVGTGIVDSLRRRRAQQIEDNVLLRPPHEILGRAFQKKYGSATAEENRNKGLPSIKAAFEAGKIGNLIVITNNVILDFANIENSRTFGRGEARFKGTFYTWTIRRPELAGGAV